MSRSAEITFSNKRKSYSAGEIIRRYFLRNSSASTNTQLDILVLIDSTLSINHLQSFARLKKITIFV